MNRRTSLLAALALASCLGMQCPANPNPNPNPNNPGNRVGLNVVKLTNATTTERGPAVGDGVLAFNTNGNATLAWLKVGETIPKELVPPTDMAHDATAFHFSGKKLVVRDRRSGNLFVFDTETQTAKPMLATSINMGSTIGPNLWEVDANLVATVNATTTTTDGGGRRIKMVDISNINSYVVTPFLVDPALGAPNAIDIDTANKRIVARTGDTFYVYDINNPSAAPQQFTRGVLLGGTGTSDIQIQGNFVVFFDNNDNFTLLNLTDGLFTQAARNPARASRGVSFEESRYAFLTRQNTDDGTTISVLNRCLSGTPSTLASLLEGPGTFINGANSDNGRIGFGATVDVSPDGKYVFVAGETSVDVSLQDRLSVSIDGAAFKACVEVADINAADLRAIRAAGASCSNNLVAWNYPIDPTVTFSTISVAYAVLPPP